MHIGSTKYTAHYENGGIVAQWISVEMIVDGANGESALDALDRSQETVQQWYRSKNLPIVECNTPPPGPPPVINVDRTPEDIRVAQLIKDIYACTELDGDNGLSSYSKVAATNRETQAAFDIMEKKLKKYPKPYDY